MNAPPTTVVVADDHAPPREMVVQVLRDDGFDVVAEAADAAGWEGCAWAAVP